MYNISVVIPTYNREKFIKKAVESVLRQKGQHESFDITEIIVVDDGSTDDTEKAVKEIKDDRVIYHRLPNNMGANAARNAGVDMSAGNWIAFQDSDDEWHDDKLKKQVEYASRHTDCMMISHPIRAIFNDGSIICTRVVNSEDVISELAKSNFLDTPSMLVEKNALIDTGGFDVEMKSLQDWEFAVRFADKYKIGMVSETLLDADMKVEGISANAARYYESRCKLISKNREIFIRHGCFDDAVKCLLVHAQEKGILDSVGKMLELYLR